MNNIQDDLAILRPIAQRYSEVAALDIQIQRMERYRKSNNLESVRPLVLIDEVPWGEISDDDLVLRCAGPQARQIEQHLRQSLYQWEHFQADLVIPPAFTIRKRVDYGSIGIEVQESLIRSDTGTYATSHEYSDQLSTEDDLARLELPRISYDRRGTEELAGLATEVFDGLMPVVLCGSSLSYNIWDRIAEFRGVQNLLMDLATRPEFMHKVAGRFAEIAAATFAQLESLNLLEPNPLLVHCTPATAAELPAPDFDGKVRPRDVWGRCAAQIFAAVSPQMHDEFDLTYNQELFGDCGLLYYGCCEPMDGKIDILRSRFKNLRKISITPWASPDTAASKIMGDYVLAAKPNPAFVNSRHFASEPVVQEITGYLEACSRYGTTCEFVLKDISTIDRSPETLSKWAATVSSVIDKFY